MQSFKQIFFAALFTLTAFSIITYMSCSVDKCKNVACVNTGACQDGKCICPSGFTGEHCETAIVDPCAAVSCQNGGTCSNGICTCPVGYEGTYCEHLWREKFIAVWHGYDSCNNGAYFSVYSTISEGTTVTAVKLNNPSGTGQSAIINGTLVDATHISFPAQTAGPGTFNSYNVTYISPDSIKIDYSFTGTGGPLSCSGIYTK